MDVVNRLLDCKEIDVDVLCEIDVSVLNNVSGIVHCVTSHLQILFSIFFFFWMCCLIKIVLMVKKNIGWNDRTDSGFRERTFGVC